jgi:hypothetical protein
MKSMALAAFACAVALASTGAGKPANATTITETVGFTASGFGAAAPVILWWGPSRSPSIRQ